MGIGMKLTLCCIFLVGCFHVPRGEELDFLSDTYQKMEFPLSEAKLIIAANYIAVDGSPMTEELSHTNPQDYSKGFIFHNSLIDGNTVEYQKFSSDNPDIQQMNVCVMGYYSDTNRRIAADFLQCGVYGSLKPIPLNVAKYKDRTINMYMFFTDAVTGQGRYTAWPPMTIKIR